MWNVRGGELSRGVQSEISAEWISKIGLVVEEADESVFWLEMLGDCEILPESKLADLLKEARELSMLFTASQRTARNR